MLSMCVFLGAWGEGECAGVKQHNLVALVALVDLVELLSSFYVQESHNSGLRISYPG